VLVAVAVAVAVGRGVAVAVAVAVGVGVSVAGASRLLTAWQPVLDKRKTERIRKDTMPLIMRLPFGIELW
jgi:hypothetical protein